MDNQKLSTTPRLYLGDHLKVSRIGYTHHGIYCGQGIVIAKTRQGVCQYSLDEFAAGAQIETVARSAEPPFSRGEIVERAKSRLGDEHYNVLTDNCEHFANWCIYGEKSSTQVKRAAAVAATTVAAATVTAGVAIHHLKQNKIVNVAANVASAHPATGAVKVALMAVKAAQAVGTANDALKILKEDKPYIEKGMAICGVVAGLSQDDASKIASKAHKIGSHTLDLGKQAFDSANIKTNEVISSVSSNIKQQSKKIISHLPLGHKQDSDDQ